jgi:SpoVK/Ycf46/Vps4 family AAA+-type ATPase
MTESWKAVLLIDECDMFLEKRSDGDIQKNAIVGIFLRLLERHTGVMFLTTNRITSLDPAFESRISVNIGYKELDEDSRFKIWNNLLTAANVNALNDDDVKCLAKLRINGRQIKNSIRMSQALSCDLKEELTINHFNTVNEHISF